MTRNLRFAAFALLPVALLGCAASRQPKLADKTLATVLIESEPAGASLYLNGKLTGTTPYRFQMTRDGYAAGYFIVPDLAEMVFQKKGYHRTTKIITEDNCYQELHLEVVSEAGVLEYGGHLTVFLDEKEGEAEAAKAQHGMLTVKSTPPSAEVYLNDNMVGVTPAAGLKGLKLQAGSYNLRLVKQGYKVWERNVDIIADNEIYVSAELEKSW